MQRIFQQAYHIPGTLAANIDIRFTMPMDAQLVHVSAVASNDSDATLAIGESGDPDGYKVAAVIGDSQVPVEWGIAAFDGALLTDAGDEFPRPNDGDIVVLTLDFDGTGGTAANDVTIILTFVEG